MIILYILDVEKGAEDNKVSRRNFKESKRIPHHIIF